MFILLSELEFFYQNGASHLFPEAWSVFLPWYFPSFTESDIPRDEFIEPIPEPERKDMILAYHAQLNSPDEKIRLRAAKAWSKWE